MNFLFLITARGGSKGIPKKNIKPFFGQPLLHYSIRIARQFASDENICLSTDDKEIIHCAEAVGLQVPFVRPDELSGDTAGSNEVIVHAVEYYRSQGKAYDGVVLLQPTSPLRLKKQIEECLGLFSPEKEAVIAVKETKTNPYINLFTLARDGSLEKVLQAKELNRRQDAPQTYEINGAIYIFSTAALQNKSISALKKTAYVMPFENSVDIDTMSDWQWGEYLLEKQIVKLDYE